MLAILFRWHVRSCGHDMVWLWRSHGSSHGLDHHKANDENCPWLVVTGTSFYSTQLAASMSWLEGPFRAYLALSSKSNFTMPHLIFYAKINDHGICRGNMGQILARWRRPVASRVVLDLPHWAMCSAPQYLIRMAIKMARKAGTIFSVIELMSRIT